MSARAIIVGAPRSGSGKTSVTIGLVRALKRRGLKVAAAKSGPDYIDPGFHAVASGRPGVNLDSWSMPPDLLGSLLAGQADGAELLVIESAMGLFDGVETEAGRGGSAADIARRFGIPVLLVLDASGQSQTAGAVARGFALHDPGVRIAGVVLNKLGSERHERLCANAVSVAGVPVLGALRRNPEASLPERHLGLVQAGELGDLDGHIERLADLVETGLDLDAVVAAAGALPVLPGPGAPALPPPGQRIALARDDAFSFVYPHVLAGWRRAGADIRFFSPLADEAPDPACDVCWLPGGYPELHGGRLAGNLRFAEGMRAFAARAPVHGECGGFMTLGATLEDADGVTHRMLGLLGHATSFATRKMNLGYRQATLLADCAVGRAGTRLRGHEFHYARLTEAGPDEKLAELADGEGRPLGSFGARRGLVSGTFFHAIAVAP